MTERLDRIEVIAQQNAEAIRLIVSELVPAIRLDAERTSELTRRADTRSAENELRFNNLLAEARADREEWRAGSDAARAASEKRFEEQMAEIRALGEQNRALLSALANTNGRIDALEQAS